MALHNGLSTKIILTSESRNKLAGFFSLLITIDKRMKKKGKETKKPKYRDIKTIEGSLICGPCFYLELVYL